MSLHRRKFLEISLGASATPLLLRWPGRPQGNPVLIVEQETLQAHPAPLDGVRLTGGPLKHAQELDGEYLLALEPDRMLAFYRSTAGLEPKAEGYSGWDGPGRNLTGHIGGHWLSAVSLMYAATGDERYKERADYMVAELKVVQEAHGDGYVAALEGGERCFGELSRGEIRAAAFDLNGEWSPWYTLHKTYAGLRDAYRYTGNQTALELEIAFAAWAEGILAGLTYEQIQHSLTTEFGGMNEVMVDLYADTGDERWLELSYKFEHHAFIDPLTRHQDNLAGVHGNTQVPKLIGSADRFAYTGDARDLIAASFFFDCVAQHHSFSSGGHGKDEYFGPPDEIAENVDGRTAESCNVYNMIKLARRLFELNPDPYYADFHERALFNHILASMDPDDGATCYMVPVGLGVTREYQNMFRSFTCCVGSGMESHALHGDGLFYRDDERVWINQFAPAEARWADAGIGLAMDTDFPLGESATLTMQLDAPRELTLSVRRPFWVADGFAVRVNGRPVDTSAAAPMAPREGERDDPEDPRGLRRYDSDFAASTYVDITRRWSSGDTVQIDLPKQLRVEPTPDDPRRVSLMWGPLVLAGDLGPEPERGGRGGRGQRPEPPTVPVFVAAELPIEDWVEPVPGTPGAFRSVGVGRTPDATGAPQQVDFRPMYQVQRRVYSTYWDLFTAAEWEDEKAAYAAESERVRRLEAATVAYREPGETTFDRPFNLQAPEDSQPQRIQGRPGRRGQSWFSYDVPVEDDHPMVLILTYYSDDRRGLPASFEVQVDGQVIAAPEVDRDDPPRFYDVEYPVPAALVRGKETVTVRFEAEPDSQIATIFGMRMIRGDAPR